MPKVEMVSMPHRGSGAIRSFFKVLFGLYLTFQASCFATMAYMAYPHHSNFAIAYIALSLGSAFWSWCALKFLVPPTNRAAYQPTPNVPIIAPGVVRQPRETFFWEGTAQLGTTEKVRQFRGGIQGLTVPLGFGLRYRLSGINARSAYRQNLLWSTWGQIYLTNQRLIFKTRETFLAIPWTEVSTYDINRDGITLACLKSRFFIFRTKNNGLAQAVEHYFNSPSTAIIP